jgi:hypothetical protein
MSTVSQEQLLRVARIVKDIEYNDNNNNNNTITITIPEDLDILSQSILKTSQMIIKFMKIYGDKILMKQNCPYH